MVWMYLSLLNYLPMHRHFGSFRFGAITNKGVMNIHKFFCMRFFSSMNAQEYSCCGVFFFFFVIIVLFL